MPKILTSGGNEAIVRRKHTNMERQASDLSKFVQQRRFQEDAVVVVVCKPDTITTLDGALEPLQRRKWHGGKGVLSASFLVTEPNLLQASIEEAASTSSKRLFLVVSGLVDHITFAIPPRSAFTRLCILKCPHDSGGVENHLLVSGMSTFRGTAIQDWQNPEHLSKSKSKLHLGPGVYIQVVQDLPGSCWSQSWEHKNSRVHTVQDRKYVRTEFEALKNEDMDGEWWKSWRDRFALLMGGLSGASTLAAGLEVTAQGIFFQYRWSSGETISEGSTQIVKSTALGAVAGMVGKATLLGPGVAAGIYFIPWGKLLSWLGQMFEWIRDILNWLWEKIKTIASAGKSYIGRGNSAECRQARPIV